MKKVTTRVLCGGERHKIDYYPSARRVVLKAHTQEGADAVMVMRALGGRKIPPKLRDAINAAADPAARVPSAAEERWKKRERIKARRHQKGA